MKLSIIAVVVSIHLTLSQESTTTIPSEINERSTSPATNTTSDYQKSIEDKINQSISKLLRPGVCGNVDFNEEPNDRPTRLKEHPWVVGIGYWYPEFSKVFVDCSGVLISSRHVLTQGACIRYTGTEVLFTVQLGDWNTTSVVDCVNGLCSPAVTVIRIQQYFTEYNPLWPYINDIGLLKLEKEIKFSKWIAPICLPYYWYHITITSYVGSSFVVSGWSELNAENNNTEVKLKKDLVIASDDVCQKFGLYAGKYNNGTHFCSTRTLACTGDGPVMGIDGRNPDKPYWYLFGLFTNGKECFDDTPKLGTKVVPYLSWIFARMAE